jgi:hypothetical protein
MAWAERRDCSEDYLLYYESFDDTLSLDVRDFKMIPVLFGPLSSSSSLFYQDLTCIRQVCFRKRLLIGLPLNVRSMTWMYNDDRERTIINCMEFWT